MRMIPVKTALAFSIMAALMPAQSLAQATQHAPRTVTITGRLLLEDRTPIVGIQVMIMEAESKDGKVTTTLKVGPGGKVANPHGTTNKTGRFSIVADPSFWGENGYFTLRGGFLPGTATNAGILRGPGGVPLILSVDSKTSKIDIGDIVVKEE